MLALGLVLPACEAGGDPTSGGAAGGSESLSTAAPSVMASTSPGATRSAGTAEASGVAPRSSAGGVRVDPPCAPEPALALEEPSPPSDAALLELLRSGSPIGSASIGTPARGSLVGAVELSPIQPDGTELFARSGKHPYATERVVRLLERALREVHRCHPGGHRVHVGDLSRQNGGPLAPHRSHQSGLDADVGFFYRPWEAWYVAPTADVLDGPRTWALLRALFEGGHVELVFLDRRVQTLLVPHACASPGALDLARVFPLEGAPCSASPASPRSGGAGLRWRSGAAQQEHLLRHEWGHHTHFHVRFTDPAAVERGARIERLAPKGLVRAQGRAGRGKEKWGKP